MAKLPLPGIAARPDGSSVILGKVIADAALTRDPGQRPQTPKRAEFEAN
ncbi:hypothetical protein [Bradyrhizobium sp. ORS 285]